MTAARRSPADGDQNPANPDVLRLRILGPLRIHRGGTEVDAGPRQQRCLLALLLAREGRPISTTSLIELIWASDPPPSAVNVVHKYIGALRRLLEPDLSPRTSGSYLARHGNGYRLVADAQTLDLVAFRQLTASAKASLENGEPAPALDRYLEALRLFHGNTAETLSDGTAAGATFAAVDGEFFDAVVTAAGIAIGLRRSAQILAPLRLAARMGRLNEPVHAALISTLAAAGHQAEALAAYQSVRGRLAEELGIDPGTDLHEAHRMVLTQAVNPLGAPAGTGSPAPAPMSGAGQPPLPLVRPAQLPPDLPFFAGRTDELATLSALVGGLRDAHRTSPLVVALDGMAGVGKSTLASHFAHAVAGEFTDGQLYLDLQGEKAEVRDAATGDGLRSLLYALGVQIANVPDTFDTRIGMYRSLTAKKRFLVLLDNVLDVSQVRPLLPNSADSLVLVTSRRTLVGLAVLDGAHLIHLDVPDPAAARELLERRLAGRPDALATDAEVVDEIIELCGRLPLALAVLAARLIARPSLSTTTVLGELRSGAGRLAAFPGGRGLDDLRTAFSWSYRRLSAEAARLFRLMSIAPDGGLTLRSLTALADRDRPQILAALSELVEVALVSEDAEGRLSSHVLVKAYAEELLRATGSAEERDRIAELHRDSSTEPGNVDSP